MAEELTANSSASTRVPAALSASPSGSSPGSAVVPNDATVISKRPLSSDVSGPPPPVRPSDIGKSLEGQQLGQFRLEEFVGGGGMGAVFRGIDTSLDRVVAVKVVSSHQTDEDTLRRFRNEALSAARLDHPNIARVYSVGEEAGWSYIVFEFIQGVNIRDLVAHKGPLPVDEAVSYVIQAAEALEHASQRNVVHRDIKPSNLLVMEDGRAKLVDMGLARLHQVESSANDLTATGVTLGTFDYISPEQARDPRDTDVRSDLYSLGCTFYYMLTGLPPFPEGTVLQKLLSHSSEHPPDPRDFRADVPPEISAIVLKLMGKQPSQRYQRPSELIAALTNACQKLGITTPVSSHVLVPVRDATPSALWRHLPWAVPASLLLTIVLLVEALAPDAAEVTRERMMPPLGSARVAQAQAPEIAASSPAAAPRPPTAAETAAQAPVAAGPSRQAASNGTATAPTTGAAASVPDRDARDLAPVSRFADSSAVLEPPQTSVTLEDLAGNVVLSRAPDGSPLSTEPTRTSSPRTPVSATPEPRATRLIVLPEGPPTPDPMVVRSLEEALRRLRELPDVNTIELQCDEYLADPLTLDVRDDLTIEAAPGFTPVLVFRRADIFGDRRMMNVLGGKLQLKGIHFQVFLPAAAAEGWSLFYLNQVKEISLTNCSITIANPDRVDAAFFHVQGPPPTEMMDGEDSMAATRPSIRLDACVARGQANFIRATEGLLFKLSWTQGFLATTERLAELSSPNDALSVEVARITLKRVTAVMQRGLCLVSTNDPAARLPQVAIDCESCLLDHDESAPLVEHLGVANVEMTLHSALSLSGRSNAYPQIDVLWRLQPLAEEPREIRWGERNENDWYTEVSSERYTPWAFGPPSAGRDIHEVTPDDYLVEDEQLGFDPVLLPLFPAAYQQPPEPK